MLIVIQKMHIELKESLKNQLLEWKVDREISHQTLKEILVKPNWFMRNYLGLAILILLASAAAAVLGPWMLLAILAAGIFWFLAEIPLFGIIALLLGIIAGQIIRLPIGGGTIVASDLILFAVIFRCLKVNSLKSFILPFSTK